MANDPSSTPPLTPSIPLHMAGFLAGTTVHIEGDAGDLHFSGQLDIHQQPNNRNFGFSISPENPLSCLLSPITPIEAHDEKDHQIMQDNPIDPIGDIDRPEFYHTPENHRIPMREEFDRRTRLRSGSITPVTYFHPRGRCGTSHAPTVLRSRKRRSESGDLLERLLRRRSFPVRPCNSYTFFVMANWGAAKSATFEETSRRLAQMWHKLSERDKKEFTTMASKDNARYRKQCVLLKRKEEEDL